MNKLLEAAKAFLEAERTFASVKQNCYEFPSESNLRRMETWSAEVAGRLGELEQVVTEIEEACS